MSDAITVNGLVVRFGRQRVLDQLDLAVAPGGTTVMLGSNGAGKSTLLRVLLGLLRPQAGTVQVFGRVPQRAHKEVTQRIGYVPDTPDCPDWMTPSDLFKFLRPHYPTWDSERAGQMAERLAVPMGRRFRHLSRGHGMKAMLVAALAPDPELLLLDEPFAGLDPLVREEVLQGVLADSREGGRTVLCATHELEIAARIADRVAVLQGGRIVRHGTLAEVLGQQEPSQVPRSLHQLLAQVAGHPVEIGA